MSDAEFIIIGSGPAGVSAAFPLVEAGRSVLMLDGASGSEETPLSGPGRALGVALEGLTVEDGLSPKLRTPEARRAMSRFADANQVVAENFVTVGALARGGLSRVWGAFAAEFEPVDIQDWPVAHAALAPSYERVTRRVGISGSSDDAAGHRLGASGPLQPPLPLGAAADALLRRYRGGPLLLGRARNAMLSVAQDGRAACDLRNDCLWGCPVGAIYDARQDLARLARHPGFRLVDGACAVSLEPEQAGWRVRAADGRDFSAGRVLLAAGTLGSTRLAAPLLGMAGEWPLLTNPVIATPLLLPTMLLGKVRPTHSLAQLAHFLPFGEDPQSYVSGAVYETAGLPLSGFAGQLPLGRRAGEALFGALAPALLVAVTYFSGAFSRNRLSFDPATGQLRVTGGFDDRLPALQQQVSRRQARLWRGMGAYVLPGGRLAMPGTDAHLAGSLPMGGRGPNGTSVLGELSGRPGLHAVDGAILPSLPSKHATLTIMANADRIAAALAVE